MSSSAPVSNELESHALPTGGFQYTRVGLQKLADEGASEYTLVTIVNDVSSSVGCYVQEMEDCLKESIKACQHSPRADNLLIRHLTFESDLAEMHGFRSLANCNLSDYDGSLNVGGMTASFDAAVNAIEATSAFGGTLTDNDIDVNGIVIVITDGCENASSISDPVIVLKALNEANRKENLESLMVILVGVGVDQDQYIKDQLDDFYKQAKLTQFVTIKDANEKELAKLAAFVSQSISSQSQALGSGQASQPIQPKF